MISCRKATELISRGADEPLSLKEQFQLRIHLFVCEFCQQFKNNLETIKRAVRGLPEQRDDRVCDTGEKFKEKLKHAIKEKSDER